MAPHGMKAFLVVWSGQLVSVVGSTLTGFALQVWVYLETGSVTQLALVGLFMALPSVVLSPVAGALVDRWDRRLAMLGADVLAALGTLGITLLHFAGMLELWHIYALVGLGAIGNTIQMPAWMAALPLLVPKRHLGRANGLVQVNEAVALVAAPAIAGAMLATIGLGAVLVADLASFGAAVCTLAVVRFPSPERPPDTAGVSIWDDIRIGWRYLRERAGLVWLLGMYAGVNFVLSFTTVLMIPLIVTFSSESAAGGVLSIAGIGMLAGSVAVSAWGGPRRRIPSIVGGIAAIGCFVTVIGIRPSVLLVGAGVLLMMGLLPAVNAASQVIWQTKVAPALQGRVFALRRMISQAISPIAIVIAGPLADRVFEPLLAEGGALAGSLGSLIGTGPGRGIGLMVVCSGLGTIVMAGAGWLHPRVRNLESELPDQIADDPPVSGAEEPQPSTVASR
jgi:MFS family permease